MFEAHTRGLRGYLQGGGQDHPRYPQNQSEVKSARAEGMDEESVTAYFRSFVEEIVREFELMSRLKGTANVVSYEDHEVVPHEDG